MFINTFLSLQARSQRTFLWIIQCSEIRLVEGLVHWANEKWLQHLGTKCLWNSIAFPRSDSPLHTRQTANDNPTCVLARCPEKQYHLVSMTERQLAKDLLYREHKLACKSAPRCPPFPSLLQNIFLQEFAAFLLFSPQQRELLFSKRSRANNFWWL